MSSKGRQGYRKAIGITQPRRNRAEAGAPPQRGLQRLPPIPADTIPFPVLRVEWQPPAPRPPLVTWGPALPPPPTPPGAAVAIPSASTARRAAGLGLAAGFPPPAAAAGGPAARRLLSARMVHHSGSIQSFRQQKGEYKRRCPRGGHREASGTCLLCGCTGRGHTGIRALSPRGCRCVLCARLLVTVSVGMRTVARVLLWRRADAVRCFTGCQRMRLQWRGGRPVACGGPDRAEPSRATDLPAPRLPGAEESRSGLDPTSAPPCMSVFFLKSSGAALVSAVVQMNLKIPICVIQTGRSPSRVHCSCYWVCFNLPIILLSKYKSRGRILAVTVSRALVL